MIGIYGGTFDPPHRGHLHVADTLRKFLQLREVWWVVTKSNALKPSCREGLSRRQEQVRQLISNQPRMRLISALASGRVLEVVRRLYYRYPEQKFVFIAGTDCIKSLHKWYMWKEFGVFLPIIFLERPNYVYNVVHQPFCVAFKRILPLDCESIRRATSGWGIVRSRRSPESSTDIRKRTLSGNIETC